MFDGGIILSAIDDWITSVYKNHSQCPGAVKFMENLEMKNTGRARGTYVKDWDGYEVVWASMRRSHEKVKKYLLRQEIIRSIIESTRNIER